jgi:hypothetical protein
VGLTTPHSKKLIVTKVEKKKSWTDLTTMERVGDRWEKVEGYYPTGQSPQWAVVPMEKEEEEEELATFSTLSRKPDTNILLLLPQNN